MFFGFDQAVYVRLSIFTAVGAEDWCQLSLCKHQSMQLASQFDEMKGLEQSF